MREHTLVDDASPRKPFFSVNVNNFLRFSIATPIECVFLVSFQTLGL